MWTGRVQGVLLGPDENGPGSPLELVYPVVVGDSRPLCGRAEVSTLVVGSSQCLGADRPAAALFTTQTGRVLARLDWIGLD